MDETENLMPREKMLQYGIEALTDVELLALFLRVGTRRQDVLSYAQALLQRFGSLYALLSADKAQIAVDGLGLAKYAQLKGLPSWRDAILAHSWSRRLRWSPLDDARIFAKPADGRRARDLYGDLFR
jgi:DNA repair protein RadC